MKYEAEQFEFDLVKAEEERPFTEHFARLERLAHEEYSEINLCLCWIFKCDGRHWLDWWQSQPSYTRDNLLNYYCFERDRSELLGKPMAPFQDMTPSREQLDQDRAIVDMMKSDIKKAAIEGRPMPWRESEEMDGFERADFRSRLGRAMSEAGVVIVAQNSES